MKPTITSVKSSSLTVTGGEIIQIQGTSLDSTSGLSPNVRIGGKRCSEINASATEIFCFSPPNPPGKHLLAVTVDGKGLAAGSWFLDYVLTVDMVEPEQGSILGGTILTLKGRGFATNASNMHISVGKTKCAVISSTQEVIACNTEESTTVHFVGNSGKHPGILK